VRGIQVPGGSSSQLQPTIFASAMKRISKSMFASKTYKYILAKSGYFALRQCDN
jgi:hypothetical protein